MNPRKRPIPPGKEKAAATGTEVSFRQLADAMPQIVWTSQPDGTVDYFNQQWYAFTGLAPGQSADAIWRDVLHPDDLEAVRARWAAAISSTEPYEMEMRFRRAADGVYRWFLVRALPIRDEQGAVTRWIGTDTDITERKAAEAASAAITERLALAMSAARLGTWDWNVKTREVFWSPEHNAMLDLPIDQRQGNFEDGMARVHPDDHEKVIGELQAAMLGRRDSRVEMRSVHRDGSVHWIVSSGRVLYDETDEPIRMIGMVQDVTERKAAEEALRETQERFRLALLHSPMPIMLLADDGEILQINEAWARQTGYAAEEIPTLEAWLQRAYPTADERERVKEFLASMFEHEGAMEHPPRRIRNAAGEERIWDFSSANLGRLADGRCLRILTGIDMTERHRQEDALRLAKEEAERANAAKSQFLSRMSHELRTPLNAILGFSQVLELGSLNADDSQCVKLIHKGGKHLLALIDEVLDLARVEAGELALKPTALTFDKIGRECVNFVARLAQANQVLCATKFGVDCDVRIWADEQRLRQVLLNLLGNAIKYNRPGGRVTLGCEKMPGGHVRLNVMDTGAGISPEGLARLFVPFERLGQEFGSVEGTGLGLVVSRRLAEAMGGRLGAESELGVGSTFWVELPAVSPAESQSTAHSVSSVAAGKADNPSNSATLLYIEDNPSNLQVLQTVVARLRPRWRLLAEKDGESGLAKARESVPTVILLDLELPGMKGDRVFAELRKEPRTSQIPVLMLSADATAHSRERLLALGVDAYFSKPFVVAELLEKIDALISDAKPAAPTAKARRQRAPRIER